jgi:hypothetical protein
VERWTVDGGGRLKENRYKFVQPFFIDRSTNTNQQHCEGKEIAIAGNILYGFVSQPTDDHEFDFAF